MEFGNEYFLCSHSFIGYFGGHSRQLKTGRQGVRDWSLITGRGSYKTGGGGASEFLPIQIGGGGGKSSRHAEGGGGAQQVLR